MENLRKAFVPKTFKYSSESGLGDIQEMFDFMVDLFVCLNLSIKNRDYFDLDDFLYFFDNFSFLVENEFEYK